VVRPFVSPSVRPFARPPVPSGPPPARSLLAPHFWRRARPPRTVAVGSGNEFRRSHGPRGPLAPAHPFVRAAHRREPVSENPAKLTNIIAVSSVCVDRARVLVHVVLSDRLRVPSPTRAPNRNTYAVVVSFSRATVHARSFCHVRRRVRRRTNWWCCTTEGYWPWRPRWVPRNRPNRRSRPPTTTTTTTIIITTIVNRPAVITVTIRT